MNSMGSWLDLLPDSEFQIDEARLIVKQCLEILLTHFRPRPLRLENRQEFGSAFFISSQSDRSRFVRLLKQFRSKGLNLFADRFKRVKCNFDFRQCVVARELQSRLG